MIAIKTLPCLVENMRSIPGFGRINRIGMIRTTSKLRAKIKLTDKKRAGSGDPALSMLSGYGLPWQQVTGGVRGYQMMPWAIMASATFRKPAMLAPFM